MSKQFDVLIIGGGLVGATLACALEPLSKQQGLKVAIVEPHAIDEPKSRPPSFDARSSALSYGTRLTYEKLDLWPDLANEAADIKQVHVSDRGHFGITRLDYQTENVPALGYVVDNFRLGEVLLKALDSHREQGLLRVYSPAEVIQLKPVSGAMTVTLSEPSKNRHTIQASLVVLADGGRSGLMAQLGINRDVQAYDQYALIANVTADKTHQGIAYERFCGTAPMALLPKQSASDHSEESTYGLVWTLPHDEIDEVMGLSDKAFIKQLQDTFGYRAGRFLRVGRRDSYPLSMSITREQVRPNLAILGNAAHAIHPVAGQGYNLAIRDVMALAETIKTAVMDQKPVGDLRQLSGYLQKQEADQRRIMAFCDGLIKVFSRDEAPAVLARNMGLLGLDLGGRLKSRFAKAAMGL